MIWRRLRGPLIERMPFLLCGVALFLPPRRWYWDLCGLVVVGMNVAVLIMDYRKAAR